MRDSQRRSDALALASVALLVLVVLPAVLDPFRLNLMSKYMAFAFVAIGIVLTWGYGGVLSLGQGIFFGLGGYMMAMFLKLEASGAELPDFMVWSSVEALPVWWLWAALCFMGLMGTVGHFMLILAYQRASAATLTPYLYSQIGFAMLGGFLVFSHVPDGWSLIGIAMIAVCGAAGAWLTVRERRESAADT